MFKDTDCIGIFGMRGAGKTTLSKKIQEYYSTVFVFDTVNDYDGENAVVVRNYDELASFVLETENKSGFKCIIKFPISRESDVEFFDNCVELLYHRGNAFLVFEEIHIFANSYYCPPFLRHLALTGRHQNLGYAFTTQRIAEVNKTILTQAHHKFAGYVDNPNDIKTLREWGYNESELVGLDQFQFLWRVDRDVFKVDNELNFL